MYKINFNKKYRYTKIKQENDTELFIVFKEGEDLDALVHELSKRTIPTTPSDRLLRRLRRSPERNRKLKEFIEGT